MIKPLFPLASCLILLLFGCAFLPLDSENYAPDVGNVPKFVTEDFVQLSKIERISLFRSSAGHDYSDYFEKDRSMKHYYMPYESDGGTDNGIEVYSPVKGRITMVWHESIRSNQVRITSSEYPWLSIVIFHVNTNVQVGDSVEEGEMIGWADVTSSSSDQVTSDFDIAVWLADGHLISYFDIMSDALFAQYVSRGVVDRDEMKFTSAQADSRPVNFPSGNSGDWKNLTPP